MNNLQTSISNGLDFNKSISEHAATFEDLARLDNLSSSVFDQKERFQRLALMFRDIQTVGLSLELPATTLSDAYDLIKAGAINPEIMRGWVTQNLLTEPYEIEAIKVGYPALLSIAQGAATAHQNLVKEMRGLNIKPKGEELSFSFSFPRA